MTDKKDEASIEDIGCLQAIEQLYAYLDGELKEESTRAKFEHHMQHCRSCFSRIEFEKHLNKKLKKTNENKVPESLQDRLQDLIDKF